MTVEAILLDMDGVVFRGDTPIPGSIERTRELRNAFDVLFLSNNSTRTRASFAEKLGGMGLEVEASDIVNSAYATARYLAEMGRFRVHVVGERGLARELRTAGHTPVDSGADYVVAGMNRHLTYDGLDSGLQELLDGAELVATNDDPTYPTEDGLHPGAGCVVGALRGMGFEPGAVVGKPNRELMLYAARAMGAEPSECLVVGDRPGTDIAGAVNAGMRSALVMTGVGDGPGDADVVVDSLSDLSDDDILGLQGWRFED